MKKIFGLSLILLGLGVFLVLRSDRKAPKATSTTPQTPPPEIKYNSYTLEQSVVHTLLIPASRHFSITPALSQELETLEGFAKKHQALGAINGGFFDPENSKSTSIIILQGKQVADPRQNERLSNNPNLAPYLPKILNRSEFRRYRCGGSIRYDITRHVTPTPTGCQLEAALGGGPSLLPLASVEEGFLDIADGQVIRDALGNNQLNARSAVGITRDRRIIFVMVAQKPELPTTSGLSLQALADFMQTLGVEKALNLDGGNSSALYYNGKMFYGKLDEKGRQVKRPVKSVLLIQPLVMRNLQE